MRLFIDNFSARLTAEASAVAAGIFIAPAQAALLPALTGGNYLSLTLDDGISIEIVYLTAINAGTGELTVTRGREGTSATTFAVNSRVEARLTAQGLADLKQQVIDSIITSGSGDPAENPAFAGQQYIDTETPKYYVAVGTDYTDWREITLGSAPTPPEVDYGSPYTLFEIPETDGGSTSDYVVDPDDQNFQFFDTDGNGYSFFSIDVGQPTEVTELVTVTVLQLNATADFQSGSSFPGASTTRWSKEDDGSSKGFTSANYAIYEFTTFDGGVTWFATNEAFD